MMDIQTEKDSCKAALFPRVHVNETRVPGPRAPPRNKMAIFEQFTIPPHRFVPPLVQENSHKVNSQCGGNPGSVKPSQAKLKHLTSDESDVSCGKASCEALRCSVADLCFNSETLKSSATCNSADKDCSLLPSRHARDLPLNSHRQKLCYSSKTESDIVYYAKRGPSSTDIRKQHCMDETRCISLSCGSTGVEAYDADKLHALVGEIAENDSKNSAEVSHDGDDIVNIESEAVSAASSGKSAGIPLMNETHIVKAFLQVQKVADECSHECNGTSTANSLVQQMVCSDRSSEVAGGIGQQKHLISCEKCYVDRWNTNFLPSIIPKHVIGVIGQREFWEARKTMLQQQKTLSMQVLELHRLIEVQRLIAAMPGLLIEEKGKCFVMKNSAQPEIAKRTNKLVTKQSLNKEAKHCAKQKQAVVKGPKKLRKMSCGVGKTAVNDKCQNPSSQVLPLKPTHVSIDHSKISERAFIPSPFVKSQWQKAVRHSYGLCRGAMAFEPPTSGHWYNGQQVLQNSSYGFTNWNRPFNLLPRDIPEVYSPSPASQKFVNGYVIPVLDCAPGVQTSERLLTSNMATKSSRSTLNPYSCDQRNKLIGNSQQEALSIKTERSSDCNKLASELLKFTGDLDASDKAKLGSCEFRSERSGLGLSTLCKIVCNESDTIAQPAKVKDMVTVTESYVAPKNNTRFCFPSEIVSSVQKEVKRGVTTSQVIRAVPHPASEAVQAAAKILKSIQQNESSEDMVH